MCSERACLQYTPDKEDCRRFSGNKIKFAYFKTIQPGRSKAATGAPAKRAPHGVPFTNDMILSLDQYL